jgi:hypothetical protein
MQTRRQLILCVAGLAVNGFANIRDTHSAQPILKIKGVVAGRDTLVTVDLEAMDRMPRTAFSTSTPWHQAVTEFSGVLLRDLFDTIRLSGTTLQIIALNDYAVEASVSELEAADALLATRQNGEIMPISDKGPIFLVFPFDSRPELQHQSYYSRAVWQIAEINVQ